MFEDAPLCSQDTTELGLISVRLSGELVGLDQVMLGVAENLIPCCVL